MPPVSRGLGSPNKVVKGDLKDLWIGNKPLERKKRLGKELITFFSTSVSRSTLNLVGGYLPMGKKHRVD